MTMQARNVLAIAVSTALAACGPGPTADGPGATAKGSERSVAAQVAAAGADLPRPDPGLYRTTVQIVEFDMPGAPNGAAEMMRDSMQQDRTSDNCVTPADVEKGYEDMVRRSQQGDCTFKRFDVAGGRIDAAMACRSERGGTSDIIMTGRAERTSSDMDMTMKMKLPGMGQSTMRMKSRSERIGPCT